MTTYNDTHTDGFPEDYDARYVEVNWVLGSGYGYALAETETEGTVDVVLINEDADPLVVLRRFRHDSMSYPVLTTYLNSLLRHLTHGKGEEIQLAHEHLHRLAEGEA